MGSRPNRKATHVYLNSKGEDVFLNPTYLCVKCGGYSGARYYAEGLGEVCTPCVFPAQTSFAFVGFAP